NDRSPEGLIAELRKSFSVEVSQGPVRPTAADEFGMYLAGRWYKLTIRPDLIPRNNPIGRLPMTLLTRNVIEPLFGITDPRTDKRIDFDGGGRGIDELVRRLSSAEMAASFAVYPLPSADLIAVADTGGSLPP